ncbi:hypothetical protein RIR_jg15727.t1 [Rhizophagus irregularis DAOM 181602=DAOM 197198]|nr:hypothetical protein RIR_jg15727.t1 [Rhizophagus irregularis DAOM 181602=DAOM 197198]CAB4480824.1 unnamed protein product [Rhizophagus irregularis]CAB5179312.1 unnamed protein product [Rhizophagus irregularis]
MNGPTYRFPAHPNDINTLRKSLEVICFFKGNHCTTETNMNKENRKEFQILMRKYASAVYAKRKPDFLPSFNSMGVIHVVNVMKDK